MDVRNKQAGRVVITLASFVMGLLFYLYYRPEILGLSLHAGIELPIELWAAFPSFIFMPLISGISIIMLNILEAGANKKVAHCIGIWLAIVLSLEFLQAADLGYLSRGTFDWLDIIAAILGSAFSAIVFTHTLASKKTAAPTQSWKLALILFFGVGAILGSVDEGCDGDNAPEMCISRVILSWDDVRAEIQPDLSGDEVLKRTGKVHTLDHWLFVIEKYRGIHIFDTSDKLNPLRKMYLPIPGALDITIKDGILYSSAFTDLVSVDLTLLLQTEGLEISYSRQEDIFSYPPSEQFYPDFYYYNYDEISANEAGIIIGYKTQSGKTILYGDEHVRAIKDNNTEREVGEDEENTIDIGCLLLLVWMC
jgi:hypothetical protein